MAAEPGLQPRIAWVDGDNLAPRAAELGLGGALTANAYLGAFGIARALEAGRRHRGHRPGHRRLARRRAGDLAGTAGRREQYDELAGAVVAGHVIECGTQATGGNFSGFLDLPRDATPLGFPIAEIAADGSCVITKHAGTGGLVSVDTVTAQLMYEVQAEHYLGPDVTVDLDHDRARRRRRRTGCASPAYAGMAPPPPAQGLRERRSAGSATRWSSCSPGSTSRPRPHWLARQLDRPDRRRVGDLVDWAARPHADSDTEEGASLPAPLHGQGRRRRSRAARRSPARRSSWRWRRTPASR